MGCTYETENIPHNQGYFLIRKLSNVHVSEWIAFVQSAGKYMRELVEFPELPLREEGISTTANGGGIFVVLLQVYVHK